MAYGHWASATSATALGVHSPSAIIAGAVSYFPKKRFMLALEHSLQFGVIPLCHEHPFVLRLLLLQIKLKTLFGNILKRPSIWNKLRFSKCSRTYKRYLCKFSDSDSQNLVEKANWLSLKQVACTKTCEPRIFCYSLNNFIIALNKFIWRTCIQFPAPLRLGEAISWFGYKHRVSLVLSLMLLRDVSEL